VLLVAGGGVSDGRSLAAALMLGASAVWVGTRFVTAKESGAPEYAKRMIIEGDFESAVVTTVFSGRPLRAFATPYIANWEKNRAQEIKDLTSRGIVPLEHDLDRLAKEGKLTEEIEDQAVLRPMGIVTGLINKPNQSAGDIVREISDEALKLLSSAGGFVKGSKL